MSDGNGVVSNISLPHSYRTMSCRGFSDGNGIVSCRNLSDGGGIVSRRNLSDGGGIVSRRCLSDGRAMDSGWRFGSHRSMLGGRVNDGGGGCVGRIRKCSDGVGDTGGKGSGGGKVDSCGEDTGSDIEGKTGSGIRGG